MNDRNKILLMLYFTLAYLILFTVLAMFKGNIEFVYYSIVMAIFVTIVAVYRKKMYLTTHVLLGLTILGAMNILGGNIHIMGTRLYDFWLIPGIFKYDNLVHSFGIFVVTFVVYNLIHPHLDRKHSNILLGFILTTSAVGVGAMYEIIELGSVTFFNAADQVGGYFNNALDIVFNFIGAMAASLAIILHRR